MGRGLLVAIVLRRWWLAHTHKNALARVVNDAALERVSVGRGLECGVCGVASYVVVWRAGVVGVCCCVVAWRIGTLMQ